MEVPGYFTILNFVAKRASAWVSLLGSSVGLEHSLISVINHFLVALVIFALALRGAHGEVKSCFDGSVNRAHALSDSLGSSILVGVSSADLGGNINTQVGNSDNNATSDEEEDPC